MGPRSLVTSLGAALGCWVRAEMLTRRQLISAIPVAAAATSALARGRSVGPPSPYGATPSDRQLRWHELETTAFLHFNMNTFTDREWGYGDDPPTQFHPTAFDADAIIAALVPAGFTGVVLTAKHHDGFCLWPSRTTEHCVRNTAWREGKGDVVRELAEASARRGLRFGVYLSPWDRNHADYSRPEYIPVYREQLRELLTGYGPIFEVWHDGANGGDGFYGGAKEKRTIDPRTYYDWPKTWELVRSLQPEAVIFSDVGPDIRWVGNERGFANETCWATCDPVAEDGGPAAPGYVRERDLPTGHRHGSRWLPAECDVSDRPGWFWHEKENARVKSPEYLLDLYYTSVGRGAGLLLNVPPDRRGLIHETDAAALRMWGEKLRRTFATNLAASARVASSDLRGPDFRPQNLFDGDRNTYWATRDHVTTAGVILTFARPVTFNVIRLRENIRLGHRVDAFAVDAWKDGDWRPWGAGTSIGSCRLLRAREPTTTGRIRLRITQAWACPALSEFGVFAE